jgi:hypothetical protein
VNVASHAADLFRHVSVDKAAFYRCIMDVFAAAKRQYRLQLRPDEVLCEAGWPGPPPIAVYDLKTGNAKLTPSRVQEIRNAVGRPDIPVIELRYVGESAVLR